MAMTWLKHSVNARMDLKLQKLELAEEAVFWHLLEYAMVQDEPGTFSDADIEELALQVARDDEDVTVSTIAKLERVKIIARDGDILYFLNWDKWQTRKPSDQPERIAERVKRHREKMRPQSEYVTPVTPCNALQKIVTPVTRETRLDKKRVEESRLEETSSDKFVENRKVGAASAAKPNPNGKQPDPKRGCRIPEDWEPSDADYEQMRSEFPDLTRPLMADALREFRDYWLSVAGAKGVKLRWGATWRNDIRHKHASGYFARNCATRTADLPINDPAAIRAEHLSRIERTRTADNPKAFLRALLLARQAGIPLTPEDANTLDTALKAKGVPR